MTADHEQERTGLIAIPNDLYPGCTRQRDDLTRLHLLLGKPIAHASFVLLVSLLGDMQEPQFSASMRGQFEPCAIGRGSGLREVDSNQNPRCSHLRPEKGKPRAAAKCCSGVIRRLRARKGGVAEYPTGEAYRYSPVLAVV